MAPFRPFLECCCQASLTVLLICVHAPISKPSALAVSPRNTKLRSPSDDSSIIIIRLPPRRRRAGQVHPKHLQAAGGFVSMSARELLVIVVVVDVMYAGHRNKSRVIRNYACTITMTLTSVAEAERQAFARMSLAQECLRCRRKLWARFGSSDAGDSFTQGRGGYYESQIGQGTSTLCFWFCEAS